MIHHWRWDVSVCVHLQMGTPERIWCFIGGVLEGDIFDFKWQNLTIFSCFHPAYQRQNCILELYIMKIDVKWQNLLIFLSFLCTMWVLHMWVVRNTIFTYYIETYRLPHKICDAKPLKRELYLQKNSSFSAAVSVFFYVTKM